MVKKLLRLAALLSTALLLTGCFSIQIQNIINPDGSGEKVMITAMDTETYEMMIPTPEPGEEAEDPFESILESCEEVPAATCERFVDEEKEQTGVRVSIPFDSLDQLTAMSNNPVFESIDEVTFEQAGNATTMQIVVHTEDVGGEVAEESEGTEGTPMEEATLTPEEEEMQRQMLEAMDIEFLYSVTAPGPVTAYQPQENATYDEAEHTVTWELDLMSEEPTQELSLTWGGAIEMPQEEPTQPPAQAEPTEEIAEEPEEEAEEEEEAAEDDEGGSQLCATCPALVLPALAVGSVLIAQRRSRAVN